MATAVEVKGVDVSMSGQPWLRQPRYERLASGEPLTVNGAQRTCSHPECGTKLSRYNPDDTCSRHGGWTDSSIPGRGRKPGGRRAALPEPPVALADGEAVGVASMAEAEAAPTSASADVVSAELLVEPAAPLGDCVALLEDVYRQCDRAQVRFEGERAVTVMTGELDRILGLVDRMHRAVAGTVDVRMNLQLRSGVG